MSNYFSELFKKKYFPRYGKGAYTLERTDVLATRGVLEVLERIPSDGTGVVANEVLKGIKDKKIESIVVLGSGSGKMGSYLRPYCKKSKIFDIDKDSSAINHLKKRYVKDSFRIPILGDARNLPTEDGSVDVVVAYSILRYVDEKELVVDNILRVLKKGGCAYIAEARIKKVIDEISQILKKKGIHFIRHTYRNQSFARVSYGYYLIHKSKTNKLLRRKIESQAKRWGCNFVEAAFRSAGSYTGTLYSLSWTKR